jgi:hypothetical protein
LIRRRTLLKSAPALILASRQAQARLLNFAGGTVAAGGGSNISSITYTTPVFLYNSVSGQSYSADTFCPIVDGSGRIYTPSNDIDADWQNPSTSRGNIGFSALTTATFATVGSNVNEMPQWGTHQQAVYDSGYTFKSRGWTLVADIIYGMTILQLDSGTYASQDGQIIKSSDFGETFTPIPPQGPPITNYTSPMFPGNAMVEGNFISYGPNYTGNTVHNSNNYLYEIWGYSGSSYLARCSLANLPNLVGSDWEVYIGGDGMLDANWVSPVSSGSAAAVITSTKGGAGTVQYLPHFQRYLLVMHYNTNPPGNDFTNTSWDHYQAPTPWGPWTFLSTQIWNSTTAAPSAGLYFPNMFPTFTDGGQNVMFAASGDQFIGADYTLNMIPAVIS